jgi:hypothetical protein
MLDNWHIHCMNGVLLEALWMVTEVQDCLAVSFGAHSVAYLSQQTSNSASGYNSNEGIGDTVL